MQRFALYIFFTSLLLALTDSYGQGVYEYVSILKNNSISKRINQCYWPEFIDSSKNGSTVLKKFSSGKYDLEYTPQTNFTGNDTVIIKYENDLSGGKIVYRSYVFFVVKSYLDLRNDFITVYSGQNNILFNPLTNDSSSIGNGSLVLNSLPAYNNLSGAPVIQNDTAIKFSVPAGFLGAASITYRVCDQENLCKEATVNIYIVDTNSISSLDTMTVYTPEDQAVQILLPYTGFSVDKNAKHGKLEVIDASFKYSPYKDFNGKDTFKLVKNNLSRLVYMTVIAQDEPNSILVPDVFYTPGSTEITFDVSKNDVSSLVKLYSIGIDKLPAKGTLTAINNKGVFKYVPENNYTGVQTFSYKVCPQGVCESAGVKLYIGNYEPDNGSMYEITTYKNVPVMLGYQVPVNAYNFSSNSGQITYYPGWDTVTVNYNNGCSTQSIGYNQLLYKPFTNYIGYDTFQISYCITGTNDCVNAVIRVNTLLESKNCVKQCVGDCVWPGDVNQNGCVDMGDLLSLASVLGRKGAARTYTGNTFRSHIASDWGELLVNTAADLKNADCNGDSIVNLADTLAIFESYKATHSLVPKEVYSKGSFPINLNILTPDADSGDIGMIQIELGDDQYPAVDVTGYNYELDYPVNMINEQSLYVDYLEQGWFGRSATLLTMFRKPWDGRLESGFVRANNAKVSGKGGTEVLVFIVEDDLAPWSGGDRELRMNFHNMAYVDANGEKFSVQDKTAVIKLKRQPKDGPLVLDEKKLIVYPNPAADHVFIYMNGRNTISSWQVFNIEGKEVLRNSNPDPKSNQIETGGLSNGFYILKVETPVGPITRKIQIMN